MTLDLGVERVVVDVPDNVLAGPGLELARLPAAAERGSLLLPLRILQVLLVLEIFLLLVLVIAETLANLGLEKRNVF